MQRFLGVVQDGAGNGIASVTVQVNYAGTAVLAPIFSSNTFIALGNPFTNNADGTYEFYAGNGRFDIVLTKAGFSAVGAETTDILFFDPFGIITPSALTVNTNDFNPSNGMQAAIWHLSATAPVNLTGILAPPQAAGAQSGMIITLENESANVITITNQDAASQAGNRISTISGGNFSLSQNKTTQLHYDGGLTRWLQVF